MLDKTMLIVKLTIKSSILTEKYDGTFLMQININKCFIIEKKKMIYNTEFVW